MDAKDINPNGQVPQIISQEIRTIPQIYFIQNIIHPIKQEIEEQNVMPIKDEVRIKDEPTFDEQIDYKNMIVQNIHLDQNQIYNNGQLPHLVAISEHKNDETGHNDIKSPKQMFQCDFCVKQFISQVSLRRHVTSAHSKVEKEFQCQLCKEWFITSDSLNKHIVACNAIYTENKLFQCYVCKNFFTGLQDIKTHFYNDHPREPQVIVTCDCNLHLENVNAQS